MPESRPQKTVIINGLKISGYSDEYVFETIADSNDFYENSILNEWTPLLGDPKYIFDIGANIGNHSLYWANNLQPEHIFSYEPYAPNFSILRKNIDQNGLENKITPVNCALGEKEGEAAIVSVDNSNLGATAFAATDIKNDENVKVTTLDTIVEKEKIPSVDFVKIDTEGFELSVVKGMINTIIKFHPIIWVEISSKNFLELESILSEQGYRILRIRGVNFLYVHKTEHSEFNFIDMNSVLSDYISNVDRANKYYSNYIKAKAWNEESLKKVAERDKQITALKEQNETYLSNYQKAKEWNEDSLKKVAERDKQIAALREQNETYLTDCRQAQDQIDDLKTELLDKNCEFKRMHDDFFDFQVKNAARINRLLEDHREKTDELSQKVENLNKKTSDLTERNSSLSQKVENLNKKNKSLQKDNESLQKNKVPEVFHYMASSRIGRMMSKIFLWYHKMRTR